MDLGEEDLPDPLDARCSSWLGFGEGCSTLHEMGHTYRYRVEPPQFLFSFFITFFYYFSFCNLQMTVHDHGLVVSFQDRSLIKQQTVAKCELPQEIPLFFISCFH